MKNLLISTIILSACLTSCTKHEASKSISSGDNPSQLYFKVGASSRLSNFSNTNLYYYKNGVKHNANEIGSGITLDSGAEAFHALYPYQILDTVQHIYVSDSTHGLLSFGYFPELAMTDGSGDTANVFIIEYGSGWKDTVTVSLSYWEENGATGYVPKAAYKHGYSLPIVTDPGDVIEFNKKKFLLE